MAERTYYSSRIKRILEKWGQTRTTAETEKDGRFKDSYRTLLAVDLDRQAIWIEDNGIVQKNDYAELPPGLEWKLHHATSQGHKELSGRVILKMRGAYSKQQPWEYFDLVGTGRGTGYCKFRFHSKGGSGDYYAGTFRPQPYRPGPSTEIENSYGSLLVTDSEYAQHRNAGTARAAHDNTVIEENKASWLRVEKSLYGQLERHLRSAGYELRTLKVEHGPDFSAGHAEIRGRSDSVLRRFFGGSSSIDGYFQVDRLGDDIWYAKSLPQHPERPMTMRQTLDLEFLVHPTSKIAGSQRRDLLAKGRKIQRSVRAVSSKWKATLPSGATVEFIGICENPSAGKQWWGPDGSPVAHVPYVNTEPYSRPRADRKIYEFVWRMENLARSGTVKHSLEGRTGSYWRRIRDRYGSHIIEGLNLLGHGFDGSGQVTFEGLSASGYGFEKSRQQTTLTVGVASEDWQTGLVVEDKAGETMFLDKQRIILNPPEIENGQIVVRCFEGSSSGVRDCETDFVLMLREDSASKTVSLDRHREDVRNDSDTGLTEHKFTLENVSMSQIEGVCFRYRPFEFVTFKNISLVPGKNPGFEIQVGQ